MDICGHLQSSVDILIELRDNLGSSQETVKAQKEEINKLRRAIVTRNTTISELKEKGKAVDDLNKRLVLLSSKVHKYDELERSYQKLLEESEDMNIKFREKEREVKDLESQVKKLKKELSMKEAHLDGLQRDYEEVCMKLSEYEGDEKEEEEEQ